MKVKCFLTLREAWGIILLTFPMGESCVPWAFSAVAGCSLGDVVAVIGVLVGAFGGSACGMAVVKGNENWRAATNRGLRSKYGVFSAVTDLLTEAAQQTPVFVRQRGRVCVVCAGARSYLGEIGFSSS